MILKSAASLCGVTVVYPEQKWSDYLETKTFTPYPWTLQRRAETLC